MIRHIVLAVVLVCIGLPAGAETFEIDGNEFMQAFQSDMAPFTDFSTALLGYYQANNRWPSNNDLEDFLNTARNMNPESDFEKYALIDFQPQADGGLKVKYSLKSNPAKEAVLSFTQPH